MLQSKHSRTYILALPLLPLLSSRFSHWWRYHDEKAPPPSHHQHHVNALFYSFISVTTFPNSSFFHWWHCSQTVSPTMHTFTYPYFISLPLPPLLSSRFFHRLFDNLNVFQATHTLTHTQTCILFHSCFKNYLVSCLPTGCATVKLFLQ